MSSNSDKDYLTSVQNDRRFHLIYRQTSEATDAVMYCVVTYEQLLSPGISWRTKRANYSPNYKHYAKLAIDIAKAKAASIILLHERMQV